MAKNRFSNRFCVVLRQAQDPERRRGILRTVLRLSAEVASDATKEDGSALTATDPQRGFTLIELLLYVAIFALVVSIAMGVVFGVLGSGEKQASIEETQETALLARTRIGQLMRGANAVVRTGPPVQRSAFDANPGRLSLTLSDGSSAIFDTYQKEIALGSRTFTIEKLRLTLDGAAHDLTSDLVNVATFVVRDRTQGSEPDNIKIEFAAERLNPDGSVLYQASDSFHTTVSRRKN